MPPEMSEDDKRIQAMDLEIERVRKEIKRLEDALNLEREALIYLQRKKAEMLGLPEGSFAEGLQVAT